MLLQQCKQQSLVLGISESWLDDTITDAAIALPGHDVHRRDRNRRGGGVLVYVSHHVCCKRQMDLESDEIEAIWLEIKVRKHPILVCNVYRPPSSALPYWTVLGNMLESAASEGKEILLLGDFNCNVSGKHPMQAALADLATELNLTQLIDEPTRVTETTSTTIDLLFSTNASQYAQSDCAHSPSVTIT